MDMQQPKALRGTMIPAAIGMIFAFIGSPFLLLLGEAASTMREAKDIYVGTTVSAIVGFMLILVSSILMLVKSKKLEISKGGPVMIMISSFLCIGISVICTLEDVVYHWSYYSGDTRIEEGIGFFVIGYSVMMILMAIGFLKAGKNVGGRLLVMIPMLVVATAALPVAIGIFNKEYVGYTSSWSYTTWHEPMALHIIFSLVSLGCSIPIIIGAFLMAFKALKPKAATPQPYNISTVEPTPEAPAKVPTSEPVQPEQIIATPVANNPMALDDDNRTLLRGMTDEQLRFVIDNPGNFTNQAFVTEAKNLLAKRQAWNAISNHTDADLLEIFNAPKGQFSPNVINAVSIELFNRKNPQFIDIYAGQDRSYLEEVVRRPALHPDGVVEVARMLLSGE